MPVKESVLRKWIQHMENNFVAGGKEVFVCGRLGVLQIEIIRCEWIWDIGITVLFPRTISLFSSRILYLCIALYCLFHYSIILLSSLVFYLMQQRRAYCSCKIPPAQNVCIRRLTSTAIREDVSHEGSMIFAGRLFIIKIPRAHITGGWNMSLIRPTPPACRHWVRWMA